MVNEAANEAHTGGQNVRGPTEGRPKSTNARGKTKHVDIGGDVEDFDKRVYARRDPRKGQALKR